MGTVSRRAEAILAERFPTALNAALDELEQLAASHPEMIKNEDEHAFTECATFADDIKLTFGAFQNDWHFIDQPVLDEPGTTLDEFDFQPEAVNVVDALTDFRAFLKGETGPKQSKYIRKIAEYFPHAADQRSFVLRMIIHYVGDIHQPLHSATEVDSRFV